MFKPVFILSFESWKFNGTLLIEHFFILFHSEKKKQPKMHTGTFLTWEIFLLSIHKNHVHVYPKHLVWLCNVIK